jgi:hypothetical protein
VLSFLYRYPISKLAPVEAAQVEMIVTTLELQKPKLKAWGLFTISKSMLAAVQEIAKILISFYKSSRL